MKNIAIIGLQWGDEGKGKIVDWLSEKADVVVRFQGGHNAGHTLVVDDKVYKLSLLPSGVVRGKIACIGNGVVIDPWFLKREMNAMIQEGLNITPENFMISDRATLILPLHQQLDQAREAAMGSQRIGTTGRGIGPAYEDKVGRRAIRVGDIFQRDALQQRLSRLLAHHNPLRFGLGLDMIEEEELIAHIEEISVFLKPYVQDVSAKLYAYRQEGKFILFEGAQGVLLDVDHGSYPFVTSSNAVMGQVAVGTGLGDMASVYGIGLLKAYTTRVGSGPFPTELDDEVGEHLAGVGREVGTVTGRGRRCGWFDAILARRAARVSGVHGLALTKLDVLDGLQTLKICVGYMLDGHPIEDVPADVLAQERLVPIYEEMAGWSGSVGGIRRLEDLPPEAMAYMRRIEELVGLKVDILSTSPQREDTLLLKNI